MKIVRQIAGQSLRDIDDPEESTRVFSAEYEPSAPSRTTVVACAGIVAAAALVALIAVVASSGPTSTGAMGEIVDANMRSVELLVLQRRERDNQLIVWRALNSPPAQPGAELHTAKVLLLRLEDVLIVDANSTIAPDSLAPSAGGTLSAVLPGGSDVGRSRVSFRSNEQVVPHIDR